MANKFYACEQNALSVYLDKRSKIESVEIEKSAGLFEDLQKKADDMKNILEIEGRTAIINICGVLVNRDPDIWDALFDEQVCSYKSIREAINEAVDINAEKIILNFDTPGGTVAEVEITREEIKAASELIPMECVNIGMCCSAGMWLASGVGKPLICNDRTTEAGSIGVVMTAYDDTEFLSNFGFTRHIITNKQSTEKIPDISKKEGRDIYQAELNELYEVFSSNVQEGFKIEREKIDALKGRVLIGDAAIEYGLMMSKKTSSKIPDKTGENKINQEAKMTLSEFLKSDPDAKKEYDNDIANAKSEGMKSGEENVIARVNEVKGFINSDSYVSAIKDMAFQVIEGKTDVSSFKTTVAIADQLAEKQKSESAKTETPEETPAQQDPELSKDGQVRSEADFQAMVQRIKTGGLV